VSGGGRGGGEAAAPAVAPVGASAARAAAVSSEAGRVAGCAGTTDGTTHGTTGGTTGVGDSGGPPGAALGGDSGAGPGPAVAPGGRPRERLRGYMEVGLASLANGSIGVMVAYADMPAAMLLCLRMVFAAAALGIVVLISGSWRDLRSPGAPARLLGISVSLALNLIFYFLAIRSAGVAIAIFLSYFAPVYLAFVAPRILHEATDRIVYVALAVGLAGMAVMLVPGLLAVGATHYHYTSTDLLMAGLLGLVTTAFSFSIFMDGLRYIRVQHASIVAYLEPVSAPLYALIVAAGMLVVLYGREQIEPELVG